MRNMMTPVPCSPRPRRRKRKTASLLRWSASPPRGAVGSAFAAAGKIVVFTLLLAALPHSVRSDGGEGSVTFALFDNGASSGGVDVTLARADFRTSASSSDEGEEDTDEAPPGEAFAVDMSRLVRVSKYKAPEPVVATRAFREDGELIEKFEQLAPFAAEDCGVDGESESDGEGGVNGCDAGGLRRRRVYLVAEGLEFVWPFVALGHTQVVSPNVMSPLNVTTSGGEGGEAEPQTQQPVIIESMSETPRVFRVHNICSPEESRAIIDNTLSLTGDKALKRSTVGEDETTETRTSENAWDSDSDTAKALITRSFKLTNMVETAGKRDGLQLVRYTPGQGYNTHPDYFQQGRDDDFDFNPYSGGSNRFATVFIYLNDVAEEHGGFTVFPRAPGVVPKRDVPPQALDMFREGSWQRRVTEDCYSALAVPPKLGTAALFYSITPDGRIDPSSHHAACPLIGEDGDEGALKWGANIWLWNKQRYGDVRTGDPRSLEIQNETDERVYISWERKDNGVMEPGKGINMNTFEFHRFQAHFGGHGEKSFAEYTVESEPHEQRWSIRRPRVVTMEGQGVAQEPSRDEL